MNPTYRLFCSFAPFLVILLLVAAPSLMPPPAILAQSPKPAQAPTLPDAFSIYGDSLEAIRKGQLAYAASPLTEQQLKLRDGTPNEYSVTVPLLINKDKTDLSVWTQINHEPVLLSLDTGGGAGVLLDKETAKKIALDHPHLAAIKGLSGSEPATEGIAHEMRLGELTLRAIDVAVPSVFRDPDAPCILGMSVLSRYRVTLDFTGDTLTLSRGGVPVPAEKNETSITLPFRNDEGKIYLPCYIAGRLTWCGVDSGSPLNFLSISASKTLATQLPAGEAKTVTTRLHAGLGNTYSTTTLTALKRLAPISVNLEGTPPAFGTTSQIGMSSADEDYVSSSGVQREAILGVPFLLQFHKVIIDYPNHVLILQGLKHGAPRNLYAKLLSYGKPWPGYKWQASGDGFMEVPDKPVPVASAAPVTSVAQTTTTRNGVTITVDGGSGITINGGNGAVIGGPAEVIINGVKYGCPTGSVLTVGADGKAVTTLLSGALAVPNAEATIITSPSGRVITRSMSSTGTTITARSASASAGQDTISGTGNTVNGSSNNISGDDNRVSGSGNTVSGDKSTLNGSGNALQGNGNTLRGSDNALSGDNNTVTGSNDTVSSSGNVVMRSGEILSQPHAASAASAGPSRTINVNTVNGVKYQSPVGSLLTVDSDGTAHVTSSPH